MPFASAHISSLTALSGGSFLLQFLGALVSNPICAADVSHHILKLFHHIAFACPRFSFIRIPFFVCIKPILYHLQVSFT
jgi:hypothetical protein